MSQVIYSRATDSRVHGKDEHIFGSLFVSTVSPMYFDSNQTLARPNVN